MRFSNKFRSVKIASALAITAMSAALLIPAISSAQTNIPNTLGTPNQQWRGASDMPRGDRGETMRPLLVGTVSTVNGNTLSVVASSTPIMYNRSNQTPTITAGATYTVNAANAKVVKTGSTNAGVGSIAVGDTVFIQGTLNGMNVTASLIIDGFHPRGINDDRNGMLGWRSASSTPPIEGNGMPVVGGSVTAVNGNSITITNKSNVTYTIDAANATINKGPNKGTISDIAVGDNIIVQGTINGNTVVATSIMDGNANAQNPGLNTSRPVEGFFHRIGNFFAHLFGF